MRCTGCQCDKDLSQFYRDKSKPSGYKKRCKECCHLVSIDWRERNRNKLPEYRRRWRKKVAYKSHLKRDAKKQREYSATWAVKKKLAQYGMDVEDGERLLAAQGNVCPVCLVGVTLRSHLDHDHSTGAARGFMCNKHNLGLSHFSDDPVLLRRAAQYLELTVKRGVEASAGKREAGNACLP